MLHRRAGKVAVRPQSSMATIFYQDNRGSIQTANKLVPLSGHHADFSSGCFVKKTFLTHCSGSLWTIGPRSIDTQKSCSLPWMTGRLPRRCSGSNKSGSIRVNPSSAIAYRKRPYPPSLSYLPVSHDCVSQINGDARERILLQRQNRPNPVIALKIGHS